MTKQLFGEYKRWGMANPPFPNASFPWLLLFVQTLVNQGQQVAVDFCLEGLCVSAEKSERGVESFIVRILHLNRYGGCSAHEVLISEEQLPAPKRTLCDLPTKRNPKQRTPNA